MSKNTKLFLCKDCGINFEITVEPDRPLTKERKDWLGMVDICPVCGEHAEKM